MGGKLKTGKTSPFPTAWFVSLQPLLSHKRALKKARKLSRVREADLPKEGQTLDMKREKGIECKHPDKKDWLLVERLDDLPAKGWAGGGGKF